MEYDYLEQQCAKFSRIDQTVSSGWLQRIADLSKKTRCVRKARRGARESVRSQWSRCSRLFHASIVTNPLRVDRLFTLDRRHEGRQSRRPRPRSITRLHIPRRTQSSVEREERRGAGLHKAGQRGDVWRPTNVKCKDLLNVTLVSWVWLPPLSARSFLFMLHVNERYVLIYLVFRPIFCFWSDVGTFSFSFHRVSRCHFFFPSSTIFFKK